MILHPFAEEVKSPVVRMEVALSQADGALHFRLLGGAGLIGRVQRASLLGQWQDWRSVTLTSTPLELAEPLPTNLEARYYRFISP